MSLLSVFFTVWILLVFLQGVVSNDTTTTATTATTDITDITATTATTATTGSETTGSNDLNHFPVLPTIELEERNHIGLRGEINNKMISNAIVQLGQIDHNEIIIYIMSPGGSITAGNNLIQYMNYLRLKEKRLHVLQIKLHPWLLAFSKNVTIAM